MYGSVTYQKNAIGPVHVRFEYSDVFMITQNIGTPHPMMATPNTAEHIRVTMCTYVCVGWKGVCVYVCVLVCVYVCVRGRRGGRGSVLVLVLVSVLVLVCVCVCVCMCQYVSQCVLCYLMHEANMHACILDVEVYV